MSASKQSMPITPLSPSPEFDIGLLPMQSKTAKPTPEKPTITVLDFDTSPSPVRDESLPSKSPNVTTINVEEMAKLMPKRKSRTSAPMRKSRNITRSKKSKKPCKNGPDCRFLRNNRCLYSHTNDEARGPSNSRQQPSKKTAERELCRQYDQQHFLNYQILHASTKAGNNEIIAKQEHLAYLDCRAVKDMRLQEMYAEKRRQMENQIACIDRNLNRNRGTRKRKWMANNIDRVHCEKRRKYNN